MRKLTADFIFPVSSPPIRNGVIIIEDNGKILSLDERKNFEDAEVEIHQGIICPGFINAHCHLELSYLKEKIPGHTGLPAFVNQILKLRNDDQPQVQEAMQDAEQEMIASGIVAVGDISNLATSFEKKKKSVLLYHTFVECNGLNPSETELRFQRSKKVLEEAIASGLSASMTAHAPYSVTDDLLMKIFSFDENSKQLFSFHNQETEEENKLYRGEENVFEKIYRELNVPSTSHRLASSSLQAHLKFFPKAKTLLIHNIFTTAQDVEEAMKFNPEFYWCTCPNANLYIENKLPDYKNFTAYNNQICIGTDSLASNHQLSILEEMKAIQSHDPSISTSQLIQWSTLNGARFFGWDKELGSLETGKKPGLNLISGMEPNSLILKKGTAGKRLI